MAGEFIQVQCEDCENEQILFGKAATAVDCAVCGSSLASPTGGEADIHGEILEVVALR